MTCLWDVSIKIHFLLKMLYLSCPVKLNAPTYALIGMLTHFQLLTPIVRHTLLTLFNRGAHAHYPATTALNPNVIL